MCPGRSWQSIKGRFDKHILPTLNRFGTTRTELSEADGKVKTALATVVAEEGNASRVVGMSYSRAEDLAILGFIADNKRYGDVGGVDMWKLMEQREVLVGRSWQSMKERFRKVIRGKIKSYELENNIIKAFGEKISKKKEKRMN